MNRFEAPTQAKAASHSLTASQANAQHTDICTAKGRRSQVLEQTDETAALASRLRELLGALEQKLGGVLSPEPVSAVAPGSETEPSARYLVPVADRIRDTNNNLQGLVVGLEQMLPRIEV